MEGITSFFSKKKIYLYLVLGFTWIWGIPASATIDYDHQRELFKQAEKALALNKNKQFEQLKSQLTDYPVAAYLEYDALRVRLAKASKQEVRQFIDQYDNYPFVYHLLTRWLNLLAKRSQWEDYLAFYDGRSDTRFRCLSITAKLNTGSVDRINQEIKTLWLTGYSQPKECDQPFKHFLDTYPDITQSIWLRIEKAFKARRPSLAKYLAKKLDKKDQALVDLWNQAHRHPQDTLNNLSAFKNTAIHRKILVHAVDRLARRNSLDAKDQWDQLKTRFDFNKDQREALDQRIALSSALQHRPVAKELLEKLPPKMKSDNAYLWLARIYLRDEDWIGLVRTINTMPHHLKKEAEWIYWHARAYEQSGHEVKAAEIYDRLSSRSSYYGFLAADRRNREYHIDNQQITEQTPFNENELIDKSVHLLRARELFYLDRLVEARREWFQGIRKLNQDEIKQAASMASNWKWHDNAIKTVAKTSHRNDYDLRFPMPFKQQVMVNVNKHELDPSIIYGVIRRESLFDPLAKSRVGALGLMQLMPYTARHVAKSLGLKRPKQSDILQVDNNIKLGTTYFKTVLNQFEDNIPLAAAAYNAGPKNVRKWLPKEDTLEADLWVETVPFKETRNYIQAVLAYATIFDKHLDRDVEISSRMDDVKPVY